MTDATTLAGYKLLITGAASGIGRSLLDAAIASGATCAVMVKDSGEAGGLEPVLPADRIHVSDLARTDEVAAVTDKAIDSLGGQVDGLACCAGIFAHSGALETSTADWQSVLDINLTGSFSVARQVARGMVRDGRGAIVLVSSQIGLIGHPRAAAYTASKAGLNGLARSMAAELAPAGVRVQRGSARPHQHPDDGDRPRRR